MSMEQKAFEQYTAWKAFADTWFITTGGGSMYLYVIEGSEAALLIDTAYGFGNLRVFVEGLVQKPVIVANTHGHLDHAGGNGWWDRVYMHSGAIVDMETLANGPFDIKTLPHPNYERRFLKNGEHLSLGDREISVTETLGHSPGGLLFMDEKTGRLFCGDELECAQVLLIPNSEKEPPLKTRVENHLKSMKWLWARRKDIRAICPAHNGAPISQEYISDFITLDEQMLCDEQVVLPELRHRFIEMRPDAHTLRRTYYNKASFIYKIE